MKKSVIDDYIAHVPEGAQEKLHELRKIIQEEIPDTEESISYGVPTFKRNGKYVVYFAGYKQHVSIYPILSEMEEDVQQYKKGKATLQFPLNKPLPVELIRQVVRKLSEENKKRIEGK